MVEPSSNSIWHSSSRDNTSPLALVTVMGTHEKSTGSVKTVAVVVELEVVVRVNIRVLVTVSNGVQDSCRGRSCGIGVIGLARRPATSTPLLLSAVVSGGVYEKEQSVSSSSVAPSLFVAVMGAQLKLAASSGSDISVIVLVATAR